MSEIVIYQYQDGSIEVRMERETVWVSLLQMSELFGRDKSVVSRHIRNVFAEREQSPDSVVAKFAITASDGKTYQVEHFNLDVIISVGYRVKSPEGVRFRQWASRILKEYLARGYAIDRRRLEANAVELEAALKLVRATLESLAAHLLYFIVKNHPFSDLVAESKPADKDVLIRLVMNMLAGEAA